MIVRVDGGRAQVTDADGDEVAAPSLRELGPSLGATQVLLDAELLAAAEGAELWIGDLLHVDGRDACPLPFRERRALLEGLPLDGPHWRARAGLPRGGPEVLTAATQQGLPYVLAKDADSPYEPGRTSSRWVQVSTGAGRRRNRPGRAADRRRVRPGDAHQPGQGALPAHRHHEGRRARATTWPSPT